MTKENNKIIHVVIASDERYAQHMTVTMASILTNSASNTFFKFHILTNGYQPETKIKIMGLNKIKSSDFDFIIINEADVKGLPTTHGYLMSVMVNARLKIPSLLNNLSRVIYLDCDMVVRKNLEILWDTDLGSNLIGACRDWMSSRKTERLGVKKDNYFNSGLIVMDLDKLREFDFEQKVIRFMESKKVPLKYLRHDQDVLNCVLDNRWKHLDPKWNVYAPMNLTIAKQRGYSIEELRETLNDPWLIHYTGIKPSSYLYNDRWPEEYWQYLNKTDFKDFVYTDKNFKNFLLKHSPVVILKFIKSVSKRIR